jgi:hypothetical protein
MVVRTDVAVCRPAKVIAVGCRLSPTWIDDVLSDSFPASDPPSWVPGMPRPAPPIESHPARSETLREESSDRSER